MSYQLIAVIGTLGAALLGFIGIILTNYLNNRHATNLQKQKYEQDDAARNKEKKQALLDELCLLSLKLNKGKFVYLDGVDENGEPVFPLAETVNRMSVIILLYFDNMRTQFFEYLDAHHALQDILHDMNKLISDTDLYEDAPAKAKEISDSLPTARKNFEITSGIFLAEIKMESQRLSGGSQTITRDHTKYDRRRRSKLLRIKFFLLSKFLLWKRAWKKRK